MAATIIDGKKAAKAILDDVKAKASKLKEKPHLAIVKVGSNPASSIYVANKEKACREAGLTCTRINLSEDISEMELLEKVTALNRDPKVHGILVQLPLPKHIDEGMIIDSVSAIKDVDGFAPVNMGFVALGNPMFAPATAVGVVELIESTGIEIKGKNAVIVGRSNIVGKPAALLLLEKSATVTICHSKTKNLEKFTKEADILIVAIGKANFITGNMIKNGAVVIDVGINRLPGKVIAGDVEFDTASKVAGFITPVPGGVGPMTIACLMRNVLKAQEMQKG